MNTRNFNRRRGAGFKRGQPRTGYHDHVENPNDYQVIHTQEAHVEKLRQHTVLTPRNPQRGTPWNLGNSWLPEDNVEFSLDPDGEWYDEAVDAPIMAAIPVQLVPKLKSRVSVSLFNCGVE